VAAQAFPSEVIIGSDTTVASAGMILNKPVDEADFLIMMERLSGTTHQVYSGVCVLRETWSAVKVVQTDVTFRQLSIPERLHYWQTGEPLDKAGGYGIQGLAARFVVSIHGSYTNVVGLPLVELEALLNDAS
jgi:septum formation protein